MQDNFCSYVDEFSVSPIDYSDMEESDAIIKEIMKDEEGYKEKYIAENKIEDFL